METFISHITAPYIHDMNIYHNMTSHTLLACKSRANHIEEAGKHVGYNNELYMMWYYLVEGSYDNSDSSEAITIRSLIFTEPEKLSHYIYIDSKLFYIIYCVHLYHNIYSYHLYCTSQIYISLKYL